jgi:Ca-activated chloride channel homolog
MRSARGWRLLRWAALPFLSSFLFAPVRPADDPAPDPSPCAVSLRAPRDTDLLYGQVEIRAEGSCPAGARVTEIVLAVDGQIVGRLERAPYVAAWDAGGSFAAHVVEARLRDDRGRVARAVLMTPGASIRESVQVSSTPLDLVDLSVTVTDRAGRFVQGLTREDFEVLEAGRPRRVEEAAPETRPLSVTVLVDASSSTAELWPRLRKAAPEFARSLGPGDSAKLIAFSGPAYLVHDFTRDPGEIAASLARFNRWGGGTSLYDTLAAAGVELAWGRGGRQAVVLLTDGIDTLSRIDAPRLVDYLRRTEVSVETFLLRPGGASSTPGYSRFLHDLESLGRETGGSIRLLPDLDGLGAAFSDLGRELQNRYHLAFHSASAGRKGGWRALTVRTRTPGATVRTRAGTIGNRDIASFLLEDLKSGDAGERRKAAEWLGTLGQPRQQERPEAVESSGSPTGAGTAGAPRPVDPEAAEALLAALADRSDEVRAAAARSLGAIREPRALGPLTTLLSGDDGKLAHAAVDALVAFGPPAVPGLIAILDQGPLAAKVLAIGALARIPDARGAEAITRLARRPPPMTAPRDRDEERRLREERADPRLRAWALWGVGAIGRPGTLPMLMEAAGENEPAIRDAARSAILNSIGAMTRRGELRDWVIQGGAEIFLRAVDRLLEGSAPDRTPAPGVPSAVRTSDLIRALGGRQQMESLFRDLAAAAARGGDDRPRSLLSRLTGP